MDSDSNFCTKSKENTSVVWRAVARHDVSGFHRAAEKDERRSLSAALFYLFITISFSIPQPHCAVRCCECQASESQIGRAHV